MTVRSWRAVAALFSLLLTFGLDAAAQSRPSLVAPRVGGTVIQNAPGAVLARKRPVEVDFALLTRTRDSLELRPSVAQQMEIPFFEDKILTINVERMERIGRGVTNFYGTVEGEPLSQAVVTQSRGNVGITVFSQDTAYQVRLDGDGSYIAQEVNRTNLTEGPNDMLLPPIQLGAGDSLDGAPPIAGDDGSFIDVMVIYTTRARMAAGGVAAIESEIDNAVAITNSGYVNSGVIQRVRLVHAEELSYPADTATLSITTALGYIQANSAIAAKRTTYGADIVSFWVEATAGGGHPANGGCGVGYYLDSLNPAFAPFAYNVLIRDLCAVANQSFPHELGHNMGLAHDAYVNSGGLIYPYGQGYVNLPARVRTIMAYNNQCTATAPGTGCTRINYFSTPDTTYSGNTIGNAATADATRTLDNTRALVSNFKASIAVNGSVEMRLANQLISEAGGTVQVAVARLNGSVGAISVNYAAANGSAIAGSHYTSTAGTLNWDAGDAADKFISIPILQDALRNGSRTFTVTLSAPTGGALLDAPLFTTITIQDDEPDEINFAATSYNVAEGAVGNVLVLVHRVGSGVGPANVTWTTANGSAVAGQDFGVLNNINQKTGTLSWVSGETAAKTITVGTAAAQIPVLNNTAVEAPELFTITLSNAVGNVTLGAAASTQFTINDNDSEISFEGTSVDVNEAGPNVTVTLTRTGSTTLAQAVNFSTTAGTATSPRDFTAITSASVSFLPGEVSKVITLGPNVVPAPFVRILNDTAVEADEGFTLTLNTATNGATVGSNKTMGVVIHSDDSGLTMAAATRSLAEGSGAQQILVNRSGSSGAVSVNYAFANGTAANGTHFTGSNGTLYWADGDSDPKAIAVSVLDDALINATRTFTVTLSGASAGTTLVSPVTAVSITNNDNTVQFSAATTTVAETTANVVLTVARTGATAGQAASVQWTAYSGTATEGVDFGSSTGTLTWAAGEGTSRTISIPIINDTIVEGTETFTVSLGNLLGSNLRAGANQAITVSITDNDKGLAFAPATYEVTEGTNSSVIISVQRIGSPAGAASATWTTVNGTAIAGQRFGTAGNSAQRSGTLSWPSNNATNKTIVIPIINNNIGGEGDQSFTVVLTPSAGYTVAEPGMATVTVHDNDLPPTSELRFTQPKYVVSEPAGTVTLSVERLNTASQDVQATATYATVAGTAMATADYTTKTGTLTWAAGETGTKDITLNIVNNTVAELPEAFRVVLSNLSSGTVLGETPEATVSILDDDELWPPAGQMPPGFQYCACATTGWHVSTDAGAYQGLYSLKANQIEDDQTASVEMTGTFAAGNVSFRVKVSSEASFDTLRFYIDEVLQTPQWSGTANTAWQLSPSYAISAGPHVLRWIYVKDSSGSVGLDTVYLDGLVTPAFTPAP